VRQNGGEIEEEGLRAIALDEIERAFGDFVRQVELAASAHVLRDVQFLLVAPNVRGIIFVRVSLVEIAVELVEAAGVGKPARSGIAESPLAHEGGAIAGLAKKIGHREIAIAQWDARVAADPAMSSVIAGHQRAARRRAHRASGVGLREAQTARGQGVDVGSADALLAVTTKVAVAEIVGQDENDVWFRRRTQKLSAVDHAVMVTQECRDT